MLKCSADIKTEPCRRCT